MTWDVDKVETVAVEAVAAVLAVAAVVGRVAWGGPRRPDQAATACAPVAATKCLIRQDSPAIRWPAPSVALK